jgi:hypothetical protein
MQFLDSLGKVFRTFFFSHRRKQRLGRMMSHSCKSKSLQTQSHLTPKACSSCHPHGNKLYPFLSSSAHYSARTYFKCQEEIKKQIWCCTSGNHLTTLVNNLPSPQWLNQLKPIVETTYSKTLKILLKKALWLSVVANAYNSRY